MITAFDESSRLMSLSNSSPLRLGMVMSVMTSE